VTDERQDRGSCCDEQRAARRGSACRGRRRQHPGGQRRVVDRNGISLVDDHLRGRARGFGRLLGDAGDLRVDVRLHRIIERPDRADQPRAVRDDVGPHAGLELPH
jgi:hypothetical protein